MYHAICKSQLSSLGNEIVLASSLLVQRYHVGINTYTPSMSSSHVSTSRQMHSCFFVKERVKGSRNLVRFFQGNWCHSCQLKNISECFRFASRKSTSIIRNWYREVWKSSMHYYIYCLRHHAFLFCLPRRVLPFKEISTALIFRW
jgi:hypothetical protein